MRARSNPTKWVIADKDKINIDQSLLPFSPTGGLEVDGTSATSTGANNQTSNATAAKKTEPTPTVVKENITAKQKEVILKYFFEFSFFVYNRQNRMKKKRIGISMPKYSFLIFSKMLLLSQKVILIC